MEGVAGVRGGILWLVRMRTGKAVGKAEPPPSLRGRGLTGDAVTC